MLPSSSFLVHSLLLAAVVLSGVEGAVLKSQGRLNKCRVKRQGKQAMEVTPNNTAQGTAPIDSVPSPSVTQAIVEHPTNTSLPAPIQSVFDHMTLPLFDYANQKVRGVNLGGWFMMEVRFFPPSRHAFD